MEEEQLPKSVEKTVEKYTYLTVHVVFEILFMILSIWLFCRGFGLQFRWRYVIGVFGAEHLFGQIVDGVIFRISRAKDRHRKHNYFPL